MLLKTYWNEFNFDPWLKTIVFRNKINYAFKIFYYCPRLCQDDLSIDLTCGCSATSFKIQNNRIQIGIISRT